jgi:ribose transport system permease protein
VALACGLAVGCFNYALIRILRIPPIIATLSSSDLVQSAAIAFGRGLRIKPAASARGVHTARVPGVFPSWRIFVMLLKILFSIILHRTLLGGRYWLSGRTRERRAWRGSMSA